MNELGKIQLVADMRMGGMEMKVATAKPFFFKGGDRAVLLLHGFLGSSADVRMLGRFLQKRGYTCLAPHYKGHAAPPEELVHTGPDDWWQDVVSAYEQLQSEGYKEIAACGLSLGGVFSLKLGYTMPLKGIIPMCAPMELKSEDILYKGILRYAEEYKRREEKTDEEIAREMVEFKKTPMATLKGLYELVKDVRDAIDMIYTPTFVVQARHDEVINPESANIIHDQIEAPQKKLKWYEDSPHVITIGPEKEQLHEDIYEFLESLDWEKSQSV